MRHTRAVLGALLLAGCAAEDSQRPPVIPVAPAPPAVPAAPVAPAAPVTPVAPPASGIPSGIIWAMVVDPTGVCIRGATVQMMTGQSAGPAFVQDADCDAWSYSGGVEFKGLTPGVAVTIRATTPSGRVQEKTLSPDVGIYSVTLFTP